MTTAATAHPLCQPFSIPLAVLIAVVGARPSGRPPWRIVDGMEGSTAILDADGIAVICGCDPHIAAQIIAAVNQPERE